MSFWKDPHYDRYDPDDINSFAYTMAILCGLLFFEWDNPEGVFLIGGLCLYLGFRLGYVILRNINSR